LHFSTIYLINSIQTTTTINANTTTNLKFRYYIHK